MREIAANPLGYPVEVWRLFMHTPGAGRFADGAPDILSTEVGSPAGGARLRVALRIAAGHIADSRFQAYGCPYTVATGAWLANWLVGRARADLATAPITEMRATLEIPEDRAHCWLMAQDLLRDLSRQWS